ncbi:hypothetical protein AB1046_08280 [Promicromonospora sp. Populi]|uniref:hypothetical protein n=1 Tax=Promicromonospora sp. Populi TaxID=3239420 RepID=UPI0034E1A24F
MHHAYRAIAALVAATLLTTALAGPVAAASPAGTGPALVRTVSGSAHAGPAHAGLAMDETGEAVPYYVMQLDSDGTPEFLFEIAQRYLGDGNRYMEIFELNEGRVQPDGGVLTDPEAVLPGWVMQLPADAEGEGVEIGVLPTGPADGGPAAEPSASADGASAEPSADASSAAPSDASSTAPSGEAAPAEDAASGSSWLTPVLVTLGAVVVLGAVAFGVLFLLRRRRAGREAPFDDSLLRTDTSASWMVDRALRVLIAACERDGLDLPGVTGVFIEGGAMRLRLASPVSPAPAPWVANEDGQSWSAPLAKLQSAPASEESTARFARLVTIGVAETGRVLVDFATARGVISLDGPTRARHEVLRRWLGELTGNPWSNDPRVVMVGNGLPQPEQVEHLSAIEQVIPALDAADGGVLVLSQAPSAVQQDMLAERFANPAFGWVVIVLGESASAKWRITAGDDGWLRSGFLPDVRYTEQMAVRRAGE